MTERCASASAIAAKVGSRSVSRYHSALVHRLSRSANSLLLPLGCSHSNTSQPTHWPALLSHLIQCITLLLRCRLRRIALPLSSSVNMQTLVNKRGLADRAPFTYCVSAGRWVGSLSDRAIHSLARHHNESSMFVLKPPMWTYLWYKRDPNQPVPDRNMSAPVDLNNPSTRATIASINNHTTANNRGSGGASSSTSHSSASPPPSAPPSLADSLYNHEEGAVQQRQEHDDGGEEEYKHAADDKPSQAERVEAAITVDKPVDQHDLHRALRTTQTTRDDSEEAVGKRAKLVDMYLLHLLKRLLAEFLGTAGLVTCISALGVEASLTANRTNPTRPVNGLDVTGAALGSGLTLCFLIYCLGNKSGAHLNPVVTWGFAFRGAFSLVWVPLYWLAQFCGALGGAALVRAMYGDDAQLGSVTVNEAVADGDAFYAEMWLSCVLVAVILTMAFRGGNIGPLAATAVGFSFAVLEMIGWSYSGASLNPDRYLGPALVNGPCDKNAWLYIIAPFVGATLAVIIVRLFTGKLKAADYYEPQGVGGDEVNNDLVDKIVPRIQQLLESAPSQTATSAEREIGPARR